MCANYDNNFCAAVIENAFTLQVHFYSTQHANTLPQKICANESAIVAGM